MPDTQLYTNEAAIAKATVVKTNLALSKLRLVQEGITLTRFTTKDQLVALEATFDGYTTGGYTLTAWTGPVQPATGGAIITSPLTNVAFSDPSDPPVGNNIAAWWVEDAAGKVRLCGTYDPVRPVNTINDGWPIIVQVLEAINLTNV